MVAAVLLAAAAWACDSVYSGGDLVSELLLAGRDPTAAARAAAMLPCVSEPLSSADAALYHRTMAAAAVRAGQGARAVAELRAVRALQPDWVPPPALLEAWARAGEASTGPRATLDDGLVDGVPTRELWLDRASIVQRLEEGQWTTRYVEAVVAAEALAFTPPSPVAFAPPARRRLVVEFRPRPSVPMVVAGSTLLLASGVAYGVHAYWRSRFIDVDDPDIDTQAELATVGNTANAALFAAWGGTVAGGGVLAGGVLRVQFR